tara:strand:+ start:252 stop:863 length:612 start_codon:yes stop_codon:yes gene_type:complete
MIILDHEQGSDEWFAARLGRPSASMFNKLITSTGKPSTSASKYIDELVDERLNGVRAPVYVNEHMERGTRLEPEAREYYEFLTDQQVTEYGFILDDSEEFGCSPDGLIKDSDGIFEGGLEVKCPANMVGYHRDNKSFVTKYKQQVMGCMMITGAKWWDLMAYSDKKPHHLIIRVERDEEYIEKLAAEIDKAVTIIINETEKLA